jgi:tRNA(Leu) C34 or U34 (ribose-2'-O)-methylase TrmL
MGGDRAPEEIIQGVLEAIAVGIPCALVGPDNLASLTSLDISGIPHIVANEIIAMDEDAAGGVRRKKDSTLVRSAEAAGASGVVLVGSTVDPWSPKVLRASAGAMLHVPIWQIDSLDQLQMAGVKLLGTTSHNNDAGLNPESIYSADLSGRVGVVLGNEARGLDPESHVDSWVTVPQVGRSESLNVAMAGTVIAMHIAHARG